MTKTGVYYVREDGAGIWRRLLALGIDAVVVLVAITIVGLALDILPGSVAWPLFGAVVLALPVTYLVLLRRSPVGTLGYALMGLRVVDLQGERPSLLVMTYRFSLAALFLILAFGAALPLSILDFAWSCGDPFRQTLHDKLAGTYVIRKQAQPAGRGAVGVVACGIMGYFLLFREVARQTTAPR